MATYLQAFRSHVGQLTESVLTAIIDNWADSMVVAGLILDYYQARKLA